MSNDFDSNFTRKLAEGVLAGFEDERKLSKNVNTQKLAGEFDPDSGENIDFKRPTDYKSVRTSDGDLSSATPSPIITGKATGTVQDYITVYLNYKEADEAIKMGKDKTRFFNDAAKRIVTDLEVDFAKFMMKNSGLLSGAVGTVVSKWSDVSNAGAVMEGTGVPSGDWCYMVNPFTQNKLADTQRNLGSNDQLISEAHRKAIISDDFAGMKVMKGTTLGTYTTHSGADRVGAIASNPTVTYAAAKDTMTQSIAVSGFQANLQIRAGETITIAGRHRLNLSTRQPMIDETGSQVEFSAVVTADVTLDGSGAGTIVVSGPAIYEADGAYNTVDSAPVATDVVTLGGSASTIYQPNLFWHKDAFGIGSVPMEKLQSTDTIGETHDGLQIRVSKGADITKNQQIVRLDFRPAYVALNPFFAGQAFGVPA